MDKHENEMMGDFIDESEEKIYETFDQNAIKSNEPSKKLNRASRLKGFREQTFIDFLKKYGKSTDFDFDYSKKVKFTSSDTFTTAIENLSVKYKDAAYPIIMGNVSGFYETASLAGLVNSTCKTKTQPFVLFFDRSDNNIQNAIFNSLLVSVCESKEDFLKTVLDLSDLEIVKNFNPTYYKKLVDKAKSGGDDPEEGGLPEEDIDEYIIGHYLTKDEVDKAFKKATLNKLENYIIARSVSKKFNASVYHKKLLEKAKKVLDAEAYLAFEKISSNICAFLGKSNNFNEIASYLIGDIKRNRKNHLLANDQVFDGYKSLVFKNGAGHVKFLPGTDITKKEGIDELTKVLKGENIIHESLDKNEFPVDIAIIPHIRKFKDAHDMLKRTSQLFVEANRDHTKKAFTGRWDYQSTATLYTANRQSIGADFIEEEFKNRVKLNHLTPLEELPGMPKFATIAGINFGNLYTNYNELKNIIDIAKIDKVKLAFIQSLVFSDHRRYQSKMRSLIDPKYPELDDRLKAAKRLVKDLNDSGIKVIYQTGDEDKNLCSELFREYFFGELKEKKNFLKRADVDPKYDWINDIIGSDLIPYMIRSGKDITSYYDDKGNRVTRIGQVCEYFRALKDGIPLGDLADLRDEDGNILIDEQYLYDTDMFSVVSETLVGFDKDNQRMSIDMVTNPNFSSRTQYAKPDAGLTKRLRNFQTGAVSDSALGIDSQITLDSRQAYMGFNVIGGRDAQVALCTPQMTDDQRYYKKDFLTGFKQILEDPTHKRVTQMQNRLNFPGSWTISGDLDDIMRVTPYFKRPREVMEYVQKTGEPLPMVAELHINDIQVGSITERLTYIAKLIDMGFYKYGANVVTYLGDIQQGSNYARFPIESRATGAQSVTDQMIDFQKLQRPWIKNSFGVIVPEAFETGKNVRSKKVDEEISNQIIDHLASKGLVNKKHGEYSYVFAIKDDVDYKTVDLCLPEAFKPLEKHIRARLNTIKLVKLFKIVEGNHEKNTDWNHKGYKLLEFLKLQLEDFKKMSASDVDINFAEFFINKEGDFVEGSYAFSEINGYRTLSGHNLRSKVKGKDESATRCMATWLESLGKEYQNFDIIEQGHLHNLEASVIGQKLYIVIPGIAGQSGFEQMLGYASHPRAVIKLYWPDGRISFDVISSYAIDRWKIQNPEVNTIGLANHLNNCTTLEIPIVSDSMPNQFHTPLRRSYEPKKMVKIIGPKIS